MQWNKASRKFFMSAKRACSILMAALLLSVPAASGAGELASHQVTISVPQASEISGDLQSFNLAFQDFLQGSETNQQVVNYRIKANNLSRNSGVVQAKVSVSIDGVSVKADVGAYHKQAGNAHLVESNAGFISLGENYTHLCDRQTDSGDGAVAVGNFSVTYKAAADQAISAQDVLVELSIVIVDI